MINCLLEANVQKYIDLLRNSKIFSNTGDSDIVRLLERAEAVHRSYKKGEIILADGTKTEKAGFLLTGSAVISKDDFWGNRNILARITGGSMFAETFALLHDAAVNVNVTAEQDCTVRLPLLPERTVRQACCPIESLTIWHIKICGLMKR